MLTRFATGYEMFFEVIGNSWTQFKTIFSLKLYIKNMVCIRCKMVVKDELTKLGLDCLQDALQQWGVS